MRHGVAPAVGAVGGAGTPKGEEANVGAEAGPPFPPFLWLQNGAFANAGSLAVVALGTW